ncbi:MAG: putative ABC exporter domain-containing protein [Gemmatimonadales bacterium]
MTPALGYLLLRTTRNRFARQLARVKQPRYLIGVLVGIAYFSFIFSQGPGSDPFAPEHPRELDAVRLASRVMAALFDGVLVLTLAYWWTRGGLTGALAFQPAEVQMLFPGPVSAAPHRVPVLQVADHDPDQRPRLGVPPAPDRWHSPFPRKYLTAWGFSR